MSRFLKALFLALFSRGGAGVLRSKTVILNTHNICTQKSHGIICLNTLPLSTKERVLLERRPMRFFI
jgi:hypothetical protein